MLVQQLDVQRFRRLIVPVVDPVGRMFDQRPEIIVEVEHQEPQALPFQPLGQLDRGGGLAGGTGAAHPHHPQPVAGVQPRHHLLRSLVQRPLVNVQRCGDDLLEAPAAHDLVQSGHRVHAVPAVPAEDLLHPFAGKTVAGEFFRRQRPFPQPVPSPAITLVGVGGVLKTIAAQSVQHLVLDALNRGWKIRNQVMGIGVEADNGRIRQEAGDVFIRTVRLENLFVHARQKVLPEAADGFRGAQDGPADAVRVELDEGPVALLDFNNAILDWHWRELYRSRANTQCRFNAAD